MKKNILQLIGSFHQGGSERQAVQLTKLLLSDQTFQVHLATLNDAGSLRSEIEETGLAIAEFKLHSFYDVNFLRQMTRFRRFVREKQIALIHSHDFYTNIFGMLAGSLGGVRVRIASKRETAGMKTPTQIFLERQVFRFCHKITANAAAVKTYLIDQGIGDDKIDVIYNGLDLSRFEPKADLKRSEICSGLNLPTDENLKFVTIVANLHHEVKNHRMLLRAAKTVINRSENVHFVLAGEGDLISPMRELAEQLEISANCHFTGRCENVAELLRISDVGVLSSTNEGFSNSILEYMAAGKPVVGTDVGGARESIVDGETGFLVRSDDDQAMADRLIELLDDEKKAREMGRLGRKRIEDHFSTSAQLASIKTLYQKLLEENLK